MHNSKLMDPIRLIALLCAAAIATSSLSGCATKRPARPDYDPWAPVNRKVFWFNEKLDNYLLRPTAQGWVFITPKIVRRGIANFFANLQFPIVVVNDVLQWKWKGAVLATGRFAVNSTIGVLGLFDPASRWGMERQFEDTGQTFGRWGIPPGPYLVLPLWGPSNPRDALGFAADAALLIYPFFVIRYLTIGTAAMEALNLRAENEENIENAKAAALDYYVFVRNAYIQHRHALVHDSRILPEEQEEDLYDFDLLGDDGP